MTAVLEANATTATEMIAAGPGITLVDFTAEWCAPCRMLAPVLDQLAAETEDLTVVKVDVDASPEFAARYSVMSFPTLMFFVDGRRGAPTGRVPRARLAARRAPAGADGFGILSTSGGLLSGMAVTEPMMTIGELASAAHVNIETIRYYEREGILPEPPRTPAGYRQYTEADRWRLAFIRRGKTLGFTLKEIAELLGAGKHRSVDEVGRAGPETALAGRAGDRCVARESGPAASADRDLRDRIGRRLSGPRAVD